MEKESGEMVMVVLERVTLSVRVKREREARVWIREGWMLWGLRTWVICVGVCERVAAGRLDRMGGGKKCGGQGRVSDRSRLHRLHPS